MRLNPGKLAVALATTVWLQTSAILGASEQQTDAYLYWLFDDPTIVDFDGSTYHADSLVGRGEAEGLTPNAVRISARDSGGNVVYLSSTDWWGMDFGDSQPVPDLNGENLAGPMQVDLSQASGMLSDVGLTFAMELGYATYGEDFALSSWTVMASTSESYTALKRGGFVGSDPASMQSHLAWTPTSMVVPEPGSGILLLTGSCLLLLRRRKART